jgi:hypothetical protein
VSGKGKGFLVTCNEGREREGGAEMLLYSLLTSALEGGGWSRRRPGSFNPETFLRGPMSRRVHGSRGQSGGKWRRRKSLDPTGNQTPNRPCRSELLYVLRHTVPQMIVQSNVIHIGRSRIIRES